MSTAEPEACALETGYRDDSLVHVVCSLCNPDAALCGKDMTGRPEVPWDDYPDDCLVCADLSLPHAQGCGMLR